MYPVVRDSYKYIFSRSVTQYEVYVYFTGNILDSILSHLITHTHTNKHAFMYILYIYIYIYI